MKFYASLVLSILLSCSLNAQEHHHHEVAENSQSATVITAKGTIKSIPEDHMSIRIFHEPIPELKWPAMNMKFELQSHDLVHSLTAGDKVRFEFIRQGSSNIVTKIEK